MFNLANIRLNRSMTKRIIIALVAIAVLVIASIFLFDRISYQQVTFKLSSGTKSITIYSENQYEVYTESDSEDNTENSGQLQSTGELRLRAGSYYVVPVGDNISSVAIEVEVGGDTKTIDIDPYYSEDYLASHFANEVSAVEAVVSDKYSQIIASYTISGGQFYHYGDWYGMTLYNEPSREAGSDTYGVILHKVDGVWQIAATPEIVFRYSEHKDIPHDILDAVNRSVND